MCSSDLMPSSYTPNLQIEQIASGEQANTWGTTTNNNWTLIEQAVSGVVSVDVSSNSATLTVYNGAADQARSMVINAVGTPSATATIFCPDTSTKVYVVVNNTLQTVNFETVSGTGVAISPGRAQFVYSVGFNIYQATTTIFGANKALATDSNGNIVASATTTSQMGYLSDVTSPIQAQLDKIGRAHV